MTEAGMEIGYASGSTDDYGMDMQRSALKAAGCVSIFEDHVVLTVAGKRPGLMQALAAVQTGDILVVWKLARLGDSLSSLVEVINGLRERGVGFRSILEQIDTTGAGGHYYLHIMAALVDFERERISAQTKAGMAAAKRRGKHVGRPRRLSPQQIVHARKLITSGRETRAVVAELFGVDVATLRRALNGRADI
ncbi:MAG: recombinase family protein [Methyloligellaceae bacterium]